jgi:hypothetical protein
MKAPPPVLGGLYVVAYAHVDESVQFSQTHTLNVDGRWLGAVPNLALCQEFDTREFAIQHCDEEWEPLGIAAGYESRTDAVRRIEGSYRGIGSKWIDASATFEQAKASYETELRAEACSFCGKTPLDVSKMVAATTASEVRICNYCIEEFHAVIRKNDQ